MIHFPEKLNFCIYSGTLEIDIFRYKSNQLQAVYMGCRFFKVLVSSYFRFSRGATEWP